MSKRLQLRGGTTAEHAAFTGAVREVTVDTTKDTLVVHDGSTVGGFAIPRTAADITALVPAPDLTSLSATHLTSGTVPTARIAAGSIANDLIGVQHINLVSTASVPSLEAKGTSGVTDGYIQLNCEHNSHGIKLKSPPHSASASYTLVFPPNNGDTGQFLTSDGSGVMTWTTADLTNLSGASLTSGIIPAARINAGSIANDLIATQHIVDNIALAGSPTTATQSAGNNTTRIATTEFVTAAIAAAPDTNTTYTGGTGITLSGTTFNCDINSPSEVGLGNLSSSGNNLSGSFTATGNITAYSDERLKSSVETIPDALSKVLNVRGVTFDMNAERSTGVIAQELEKVLPEAVFNNADGFKSVAYGNVVGLLIEAIKEQQVQIETLMDMVGE
jgi:hypothetical protein|tara:strand:- start:128 stop:1294 length:1167 start_codon:yes stop_codon:yes gene_type:complete